MHFSDAKRSHVVGALVRQYWFNPNQPSRNIIGNCALRYYLGQNQQKHPQRAKFAPLRGSLVYLSSLTAFYRIFCFQILKIECAKMIIISRDL